MMALDLEPGSDQPQPGRARPLGPRLLHRSPAVRAAPGATLQDSYGVKPGSLSPAGLARFGSLSVLQCWASGSRPSPRRGTAPPPGFSALGGAQSLQGGVAGLQPSFSLLPSKDKALLPESARCLQPHRLFLPLIPVAGPGGVARPWSPGSRFSHHSPSPSMCTCGPGTTWSSGWCRAAWGRWPHAALPHPGLPLRQPQRGE